MELTLEHKMQNDKTLHVADIAITPLVKEDYWLFRVQVSEEGQAIVGFPKFGTVGIGFQQEEDWNTNLPYGVTAIDILLHIWHNADESVDPRDALNAIKMVQEAATKLQGPAHMLGKAVDAFTQTRRDSAPNELRELIAEETL